MLPLTFANPQDYDKVDPSDRVSIIGLADNSMQLTLVLHKEQGDTVQVPLSHTISKGKVSFYHRVDGFLFLSMSSFFMFWDEMSMMRKC